MPTSKIKPAAPPAPALFAPEFSDQLLLSIQLLGKVSAAQLYRLHRGHLPSPQSRRNNNPLQWVRERLEALVAEGLLTVIQPIDIQNPNLWRNLPRIYLDTWAGRRRVEKVFGVPFRRPPEVPSCDWRFLFHDVTLPDDLISFELTAETRRIAFGYQTHFDPEGAPLYPTVTVTDGTLTDTFRPRPDKTLIIGNYHLPHEHDCGEEQITIGNLIRNSSISKKLLVYEAVEESGALDRLGWGPRLYPFVINGHKRTQKSSRARIRTIIDSLPASVNPTRFYFIDRQTHQAAGNDVSQVTWLRGDGRAMPLPCWGSPATHC